MLLLKKTFLPLQIIFALLLIAGCTTTNPRGISLTTSVASTATFFPSPDTPIPSSTLTSTPTQSPTPTAIPIEIPAIQSRCYRFGGFPHNAQGRVVLSSYSRPSTLEKQDSYLLDLLSGERIPLGQTGRETVSPGGEWLAFIDITQEKVVIADYNGNRVREIPSPNYQLWPAYWLNNQLLVLDDILAMDPQYDFKYGAASRLIILNPFTGEQQEWLPEFPNQQNDYYLNWLTNSFLVFNPALTRLVYPVKVEWRAVVLWDLQNQKELARIHTIEPPVWSPDGKRFVIQAAPRLPNSDLVNIDDGLPLYDGDDLLLVNLQGEISRLTYFTTQQWGIDVYETGYVWSPSGQRIAFWLQRGDKFSPFEPAIVSVEDKKVVSYCETERPPENIYMGRMIDVPSAPVWSPDDQFLLITILDHHYLTQVLALELESGFAREIATNMTARGWMINEP